MNSKRSNNRNEKANKTDRYNTNGLENWQASRCKGELNRRLEEKLKLQTEKLISTGTNVENLFKIE